jgi:hypothetical protein
MAGEGQAATLKAVADALGLKGGGWGALDPASPENVQARAQKAQERYEAALVIAAPFMSTAGQASLAALHRQFTNEPAWKPDELGLLNAIGYGILREGQNSAVRFIDRQIEIAQQGPGGDAVATAHKRRR